MLLHDWYNSYAIEVKVFVAAVFISWPKNQSCEFAFFFGIETANLVFSYASKLFLFFEIKKKNIFMFMLSLIAMHEQNYK